MTGTTLGTATLIVNRITEGFQTLASLWHAWNNGVAGIKSNVYGLARNWTLECVESDVVYANGAVLYLRNQASAGTALSFSSDYGDRYLASAIVKIDGVDVTLETVGTKNIRKFTVRIHETI